MRIEWLLCPICKSKTRLQLREDTELKNFPLYCHKCKQETLINAKDLQITVVCLRADGAYEAPSTVEIMCRAAKKKVKVLEDFHFHTLRHTYTSNLLSGGTKPKDVQELLGHADVSTTMNIYAHATREAKRTSARLLDKVIG